MNILNDIHNNVPCHFYQKSVMIIARIIDNNHKQQQLIQNYPGHAYE